MEFDPVTFVNVLAGGMLGGAISWTITHFYTKYSEKAAKEETDRLIITMENGKAEILDANGKRVVMESLTPAVINAVSTVVQAMLTTQRKPKPVPKGFSAPPPGV